jgi:acyl-CoA thioesterase
VSHAFVEDTAVEPRGEDRFAATVTDRWSIGGRPNGGYLMGIALTALGRRLRHPDPLTSTGHFLSPAEPGPAEVSVNVVKEGRSLATAQAVLSQDRRERLVVLATYGDLAGAVGPTRIMEPAPLPAPGLVSSLGRPHPFPIAERFVLELPPEQALAADGRPTRTDGPAEFFGRIRFSDDMPAVTAALPLLLDAFPPAVFCLGMVGWTPTLELTVHTRARPEPGWPEPGWMVLRTKSRYLKNGLVEEDGELWDGTGQLVAQSRQLARILV